MTQWIYEQATGKMVYPDGRTLAQGYSGHGAGLNNPAMEAVAGEGPIPAGHWSIDPTPLSHTACGPLALALTPDGFDPHGRSLFRIHGDTAAMDHTASDGCIILPRPVRQAIIDSGVTRLVVVRG
jgi:hypothetical protein